jgi:hypothetical protein
MALARSTENSIDAMVRDATRDAGIIPNKVNHVYQDEHDRAELVAALADIFRDKLGNRHNSDYPISQTNFEPKRWAEPIHTQLEALTGYTKGCNVKSAYVQRRLTEPVPPHFTRVVVPSLRYLARYRNIAPYGPPYPLVEFVCEVLEKAVPDGAFGGWRRLALYDKLRSKVEQQWLETRQSFEAKADSDVLILDVDLANYRLGAKSKTLHTPQRDEVQVSWDDSHINLSTIDLGWIIALNPRRLSKSTDLGVYSLVEAYHYSNYYNREPLGFYFSQGQVSLRWLPFREQNPGLAAGIARI